MPLLAIFKLQTVKSEGPLSLWKGFTPYYARIGPQTVVVLMLMDAMMTQYKRM